MGLWCINLVVWEVYYGLLCELCDVFDKFDEYEVCVYVIFYDDQEMFVEFSDKQGILFLLFFDIDLEVI